METSLKCRCIHLPGLQNKVIHTGWVRTTEVYCLIVLMSAGPCPSRSLEKILPCLFQLLVAPCIAWLVAAQLHSQSSLGCLPLCLFLYPNFPPLISIPVILLLQLISSSLITSVTNFSTNKITL